MEKGYFESPLCDDMQNMELHAFNRDDTQHRSGKQVTFVAKYDEKVNLDSELILFLQYVFIAIRAW